MSFLVLISKPDIRDNLPYYSKALKTYSENRNGIMIDVLNWGRWLWLCKILHDLKDAKMLWAPLGTVSRSSGCLLGNRKASICSHGNGLEGCSRRACAELPARCCSSLEQRLWAHSGALILQLTRRSQLE